MTDKDRAVLRQTVENDIPGLLARLRDILAEEED